MKRVGINQTTWLWKYIGGVGGEDIQRLIDLFWQSQSEHEREWLLFVHQKAEQRWLCETRLPLKKRMSMRTSAKTNCGIYCVYKAREECANSLTSSFPRQYPLGGIFSQLAIMETFSFFPGKKAGKPRTLALFPRPGRSINYSNTDV